MKIKETAGYANRKDYTKPDDNAVSFLMLCLKNLRRNL